MTDSTLPRVVADLPVTPAIEEMLEGKVQLLPWDLALEGTDEPVDGVFTYGHPHLDGEILDRLPGVKVVSNHGVGVDHINVADVLQRGIPLGNTPGVLAAGTADLGFALLMAAGRRLAEVERYARSEKYTEHNPNIFHGQEISGSTLGIVGMGLIGEQVARRASGFDMTVMYHNRNRRPEVEESLGVRYTSLEALLSESEYVMLCVPLNDSTRGMIGREQLALMKPTASLINIARGPVVDQEALLEVLTEKRIFSAALDVTDPEPLPRDHPLIGLDNVTLTPHVGSATVQTRRKMAQLAVDNLLAGLRGDALLCEVRE